MSRTPTRRPGTRRPVEWPTLIVEGLVLLVLVWGMLRLNPTGFGGGPFDDQRYLDAARAWVAHPPLVGTTHWELRHPLILPVAALFAALGASIAAAMWVPLAAALAFALLNFACLRQAAGSRVAWLWAALFLTTPLFLRIGTAIFPEIIELFFATAALWSLWFGRASARPARLFALSGLCAGLAIMTRETSAWLVLVYAACLLVAPGPRRTAYLWVIAFAALPLAIEWLWLFLATGDPLYRLHVALHHVGIPSENMIGGTAPAGPVLLNPAIARLWKPPGLFHIHWALNPVLGLFADPKYGMAIWGALLFWVVPARRQSGGGRRRPDGRALLVAALGLGASSFAFVTYVLMISQDQRYYAVALACIALVAALLGGRLWQGGRRTLVGIVVALIALSNLALATQLGRFDYAAPVAMPLVRQARTPVHASAMTLGQLREPLAEAGLTGRVVESPALPGDLLLLIEGGGHGCADPVRLEGHQRLLACRASDPPLAIRLLRRLIPGLTLPAALTRGGTRALLLRA